MALTGSRWSSTVLVNEDTESDPRVVLITGCSASIGLLTAAILAEDAKQFKVYATMRNLEKEFALENTAGRYLGESLIIKALDVCNEKEVNTLSKEIESVEGLTY